MQNNFLDPDKIKKNLKTACIGSKILCYKSTSSTNDVAAEYAKNSANNGLVVLAEVQSAGRGRGGRKWYSKSGESVIGSIVLTHCKLTSEMLSVTVAVAVAESLGKTGQNHAKIKWPNDILVNNKKIAGILIDSKKFKTHTAYIIGIGINCNQTKNSFPDEIKNIATSVSIEKKTDCDRLSLAKMLLATVDECVLTAEKNPDKIIKKWQSKSILLGTHLTVIYKKDSFTGHCIGLDPQKGLILQLDSGSVRIFDAPHSTIAKTS